MQAAYSADDRAALGRLLTPEMRGYFEEELDGYLKAGQRNLVEDVQLMQGDLSEAWREEGFDYYATVALRFGAVDRLVDRASGREIDRAPSPRSPNSGRSCARPRAAPGSCRRSSRPAEPRVLTIASAAGSPWGPASPFQTARFR